MASSPPDPSPTTNAPYRSLVTSTREWQAVEHLVDLELHKDQIVALSNLGVAGIARIIDVLEREGRARVDGLVGSLEATSDLENWIDLVESEKSERGRPRSRFRNPPSSSIDNKTHASTATSFATPYLLPPHRTTQQPRSPCPSTRTRSISSSSTNITHPSCHKRAKLRPRSTRKQLYCPVCGKDIKNSFEKHFNNHHIKHLLGGEVSEYDSIGCGYCLAVDLLADHGKVFHLNELLRHVKDTHASFPEQLHWDFNASFHHILSAQPLFRRKMLFMIEQHRERNPGQDNTHLTLFWVPSAETRRLLSELMAFTGKIESDPSRCNDQVLDDLLTQVYKAAAQKWQPLSALSSSFASLPQRPAPKVITQHNTSASAPQFPSHDSMSFAGIGEAFNTPKLMYPPSVNDTRSPSILSPSPQASQAPWHPQLPQLSRSLPHTQPPFQYPNGTAFGNSGLPNHRSTAQIPDPPPGPPVFTFDGHAPFPTATPPPSQGAQVESLQDIYKDMGIDEETLFSCS